MKSFQDFRSEISIIDLARSIGYHQDVSKGNKWPVLVNEYNGDKIIIVNPQSSSNQGYFNPNNDKDKGTLINFIKNRLGHDFTKEQLQSESSNINKILYDFQNLSLPEYSSYQQMEQIQSSFSTSGLQPLAEPDYLISRGITKDVLFSAAFNGRIFNSSTGGFANIAFPFYDIQEKVVGIELRNADYKKFVTGSLRGNSIWHSNIPPILNRIVIAESVIDALSYHQLKHSENTLYVSIGGALGIGQIECIKSLKNNTSNTVQLISAVDNDKEGLKYNDKLVTTLEPDKLTIDKPISKDYNEDLQKLNPVETRKHSLIF